MSDQELQGPVLGERPAAPVDRAASTQSRISHGLAMGLMGSVCLGALVWYYGHVLARPAEARASAQRASALRAEGTGALPELGRIDPPALARAAEAPPASPPAVTPGAEWLTELPLGAPVTSLPPVVAPSPAPKSPAELAMERRLSGAVFMRHDKDGEAPAVRAEDDAAAPDRSTVDSALASLLRPTRTAAVRARVLPAQRLLLSKGAFIDCTLETAIDSTLPGMTTCIMATDVFSTDGSVVLLERGTKLIGETRGQVQQGAARIFVLWNEARTPQGVVVPLDSPGTDELGRSGLAGEVNRHFWQRFGAAMLVSVIEGAVQAAAQSARSGGSTVLMAPSASQEVLTEILKSTVSIPPTVSKRNGDRIQVLVARDVDFRSVYELRSADR